MTSPQPKLEQLRKTRTGHHQTRNMTPPQLLAVFDKFLSGQVITNDENEAADSVGLAACFAAEAFDCAASSGISADGAPTALLRSFLQALIDPLHPDLDYLRQDPASGAAERAKLGG